MRRPPACVAWQALHAATRKLADDLAAHMQIENDVLFQLFARRSRG